MTENHTISGYLPQRSKNTLADMLATKILHLTNNLYNTTFAKKIKQNIHFQHDSFLGGFVVWMIIICLMNNKKNNRPIAAPQPDLQIVYQQINKNKQDIELFYSKNNMKFPPILRSKNIVFMHLLPKYTEGFDPDSSTKKSDKGQQSGKSLQKKGSKEYMEKHPSICNIQFTKSNNKKARFMNHRKTRSNQFTPNGLKTISHAPKKYYISQEKTLDFKFLNQPTTNNETIQQFFNKLNRIRSNDKKNTFILTKSFEISKDSKINQRDTLSINKIATQNPQISLLSTSQAKKFSFDVQRTPKMYKNAHNMLNEENKDDSNIFKRRHLTHRKQPSYFEPWQQNNIQDEYFGSLRR